MFSDYKPLWFSGTVRSGNANTKEPATNKSLLIEGTAERKFGVYMPNILKREQIITGK